MVFMDRFKNTGRKRGAGGGYVPGARVTTATQEVGSLPNIFIGEYDGRGVGQMNDVAGNASRRPMVQDLPGRRIDTSHRAGEMDSRMSAVLEARRQNKLKADPGLSTRGNRPASGTRLGGLEGRGARPAPGTRSAGRAPKVRGGTMGGNMRTGMGMGIPQGAPTGGGMPAQYARSYAAPFGDMGMGIPHGAKTGAGLPPQYARNYGGAFGDMGMGIPHGAPKGGGLPAQYGRMTNKGVTTPVSIRPKSTPVAIRPKPGMTEKLIETTGKTNTKTGLGKGMFKGHGKALMIGAGAAVIAGLAMNRRGDGTSSGRAGMTRY